LHPAAAAAAAGWCSSAAVSGKQRAPQQAARGTVLAVNVPRRQSRLERDDGDNGRIAGQQRSQRDHVAALKRPVSVVFAVWGGRGLVEGSEGACSDADGGEAAALH